MNRQRLEFAAEVFLSEMRKQAVRINPEVPASVGTLDSYSPAHRSAVMDAIAKAIQAVDPKADALFVNWQQKRNQTQA